MKEALLGLHEGNSGVEFMVKAICKHNGYETQIVYDRAKFLETIKKDHQNNSFRDRYLAEANMGNPNGLEVGHVVTAYLYLKEHLGEEEAKKRFRAMTGSKEVEGLLNKFEVPVLEKPVECQVLGEFISSD